MNRALSAVSLFFSCQYVVVVGVFTTASAFGSPVPSKATHFFEVGSQNADVHFTAVGKPAMLRIKGDGAGLKGHFKEENNSISGVVTFPLTELKTGISMRDDHMKNKYLEIGKFPEAQLQIEQFAYSSELKGEEKQKIPVHGNLTLHGVTKPIDGVAEIEKKENKILVSSTFSLKLSEFAVEIPSYMGVKVADSVDIETRFEAVPAATPAETSKSGDIAGKVEK